MGVAQGPSESFERFEYTRGFNPKFISRVRQKRREQASRQHETVIVDKIVTEATEPGILWRKPIRHIPERSREIIAEVCRKHSVTPSDIMSPSRVLRVVAARNEAIYRIRATSQNLSAPQIAKWFRKDHTSIIHALARHAEVAGLPPLTKYDVRAVDARNRLSAAKARENLND